MGPRRARDLLHDAECFYRYGGYAKPRPERYREPPSRLFQACPGTKPFGVPNSGTSQEYAFDTRDGKRFLVTCFIEPAGNLTILMNWKFSRE